MNIVNKTLYDKQLIISYNRYYLLGFLKTNFRVVSLIPAGLMGYMILNEVWENCWFSRDTMSLFAYDPSGVDNKKSS